MQIYIMRHGQAEMKAKSDFDRALTLTGHRASKTMAKYLIEKGISFDAVLVSPYKRAQRTFLEVSSLFPAISNVQTFDFLTPMGSVSKVVNEIFALQAAGVKNLLIVSHLPLVGYLVEELVPSQGAPVFSTSSVANIELDESGFGTFNFLQSIEALSKR